MTMKANELRIGNYVKPLVGELEHVMCVDWIGWKIGGDLIDENYEEFLSSYQELEHEDVEGIPLTEQWLLKFGFEKDNFCPDEYDRLYTMYSFGSFYKKEDYFLPKPYYFADAFGDNFKLRYVHQLQNLYFALTGEELTIKN